MSEPTSGFPMPANNDTPNTAAPAARTQRSGSASLWLYEAALVLVLLLGLYLRTTGQNWDGEQHLHPDERFLTMVTSAIQPVHSLSAYFDTAHSTLNPANQGFGFFVYGTLPVFVTRYVGEMLHKTGYGQIHLVGRTLSALADLLIVFLVYVLGAQRFNRKTGLLAAAFSAFAVMQIQESHFYTVDNAFNLFTLLSLFIAIQIVQKPASRPLQCDAWLFAAFGLAYGAAMASKISAAPMALWLPAAALWRFARTPAQNQREESRWLFGLLALGGGVALLTFRIFQPYAFSGPGFLSGINPQWLENLRALKAQTGGTADFPPAMQWARRPLWFAGQNITLWGLGLPLALSAWAGLLWLGWRLWRRQEDGGVALLWGWTAFYFTWQSLMPNPTMRYLLPAYPGLALMAAWLWVHVAENAPRPRRRLALAGGGLVLALTAAWAFAFVGIYHRPHTRIAATEWIFQHVPGPVTLPIHTAEGRTVPQMLPVFPRGAPDTQPPLPDLTPNAPLTLTFRARATGELPEIRLYRLAAPAPDRAVPLTITARLDAMGQEAPLAEASVHLTPLPDPAAPPQNLALTFPAPVTLHEGETYTLTLRIDRGQLRVLGASIANETSWDDGLPLRMDGYDPFGGIYQGLNFEMYWDDNADKRARMENILDSADYILITSSRQWGSLPRLPERYPLVNAYYRHLLGCPAWETVEHCYDIAQVGTYQGDLGYDLVAVFQSDPALGAFRINDQPSEEAFTVYDHPKVFVFRKNWETYDRGHVHAALEAVNLDMVMHVLPGEAPPHPANLMLPPARWGLQQLTGTFRALFAEQNPLNRWHGLGVVAWYLLIMLLGWLAWPLLRPFFSAFPDGGYPAARLAGMLLFAYAAWLWGSAGLHVSRGALAGLLLALAAASLWAVWQQWPAIGHDLRRRKREILWAEAFFLAFFLLDLYIRWQNPDLWHPWKGGEKPMDLSYFTAVLKSATFPPYDPWFAGGYINYYYWGFVLVGMPVKLLGLAPAFAYNLVLPTLFATVALTAFALARGLYAALGERSLSPRMVGLAGAVGMVLLGNLGTVKMIWQGFQKLVAPGGDPSHGSVVQHIVWGVLGFLDTLKGAHLPYGIGDWYWFPSRAIPAPGEIEPITEFPFFTFLYADLHAHLMALGLTVLALLWAVGLLLWVRRHPTGWRWWAGSLAWGGLVIGALRPTNTWDFPTYLGLGMLAAAYAAWHARANASWQRRAGASLAAAAWLVLAALLFYQPYAHWYAQGYTKFGLWQGTHTPISAYLVHWGLFLFVLVSWLWWQTRRWLAETPAVDGLRWWAKTGRNTVPVALLLTFALSAGLAAAFHVRIAWLVVPLLAWQAALLLRPQRPLAEQIVLVMFAAGLALTLVVEIIVLQGDIARMNTVFKFYFQVWTLFSLAAAVALGDLIASACHHRPRLRQWWGVALVTLVRGAALFPVIGGAAKMQDRMVKEAPHTLDGMAYMRDAHYFDQGADWALGQDYDAIRWLQTHVEGTPVIVEGNTVEYRWGTRITIYTGLPGVVGWNWHQRQQRGVVNPVWVEQRVAEIQDFYLTTDIQRALDFLRKYQVRYIIVGQLERGYYPGPGLDKFPRYDGIYWRKVFQSGETVIYAVLP